MWTYFAYLAYLASPCGKAGLQLGTEKLSRVPLIKAFSPATLQFGIIIRQGCHEASDA
jgi:hypothetical protein